VCRALVPRHLLVWLNASGVHPPLGVSSPLQQPLQHQLKHPLQHQRKQDGSLPIPIVPASLKQTFGLERPVGRSAYCCYTKPCLEGALKGQGKRLHKVFKGKLETWVVQGLLHSCLLYLQEI
jgi:hypothetical protein